MTTQKPRGKGAKRKLKGRGSSELERYQKALDEFERAVKALHKGDAERARELFVKLAETYANETELVERVQTYINICDSKLAPQRRPKSASEMATYAIMFHNEGDSQQAVKYLSKALEMDPQSAHIQYCLAAAHARVGDAAAAARHLKQAIQTDPVSLAHAKRDQDFSAVRDASEVAAIFAEA
jgi:tetratricopeptide (TPR) repeat protein